MSFDDSRYWRRYHQRREYQRLAREEGRVGLPSVQALEKMSRGLAAVGAAGLTMVEAAKGFAEFQKAAERAELAELEWRAKQKADHETMLAWLAGERPLAMKLDDLIAQLAEDETPAPVLPRRAIKIGGTL